MINGTIEPATALLRQEFGENKIIWLNVSEICGQPAKLLQLMGNKIKGEISRPRLPQSAEGACG